LSSFSVQWIALRLCGVAMFLMCGAAAVAQDTRLVLDRDGSTIVFEPYAPNIMVA
jgi:hypothetical protein